MATCPLSPEGITAPRLTPPEATHYTKHPCISGSLHLTVCRIRGIFLSDRHWDPLPRTKSRSPRGTSACMQCAGSFRLIFAIALVTVGIPAIAGPARDIAVILVDDLSWDGISLAGQPCREAPNIDRLAGASSHFTGSVLQAGSTNAAPESPGAIPDSAGAGGLTAEDRMSESTPWMTESGPAVINRQEPTMVYRGRMPLLWNAVGF